MISNYYLLDLRNYHFPAKFVCFFFRFPSPPTPAPRKANKAAATPPPPPTPQPPLSGRVCTLMYVSLSDVSCFRMYLLLYITLLPCCNSRLFLPRPAIPPSSVAHPQPRPPYRPPPRPPSRSPPRPPSRPPPGSPSRPSISSTPSMRSSFRSSGSRVVCSRHCRRILPRQRTLNRTNSSFQ
jgi:hypothetical protein